MKTTNESDFKAIDGNQLANFINEELGGDKEMFANLFTIFKKYIDEICNLGGDASLEVIQGLAHKVRSSSISFGALKLAENLEALEQLCKDQQIDKIAESCNIVHTLAKQSVQEISDFINKY